LKQAFAVGRELESMTGDLSRWMQCASDIKNAQEYSKNPPFYKKLLSGDSIEKLAVESLMATKAIETQRYDLQQFIKFKYGTKSWEDLLRLEGQIRKDRAKAILERQRRRDAIIQYSLLAGVLLVGCYALYLLIQYLLYLDRG
tara:strand:+ start:419 stop:847 length:429 start_codon:yes stop_codon:yes gene_type:complete